jgi:regulator of sirC expression with transglutaminase-like and TPR domain
MSVGMTFEELATRADEDIDVVLGAAWIAKDVYPTLDVLALVERVRALGAPLASQAARAPEPSDLADRIEAVSARFRELGFRGNGEDYYDPRNSLLPDVLDRGLGIPITLSLIWCAIAKAAGLVARGVSFPGHFVVRVEGAGGFTLLDAFDGGRVLDRPAQLALVRRTLGAGADVHPSLLAPASARTILVRMLTNLKSVYARRGDHGRAFVAIDRILELEPRSARALRERAGVSLRLGAKEVARADLARILELEPDAPDVPGLRAQLAALGPPLARGEARRVLD